jgi:WD40 repeat protein
VVLINPATGATRHNLDPGIRTRPFNANMWRSNGAALFSPNGQFLLTSERVPTMHVWDPASGRLLIALEHTERIENAVFNPVIPNVLATGGRNSMVTVWDVTSGKSLIQLPHPRWLQTLAFSTDGAELSRIRPRNDGKTGEGDGRATDTASGDRGRTPDHEPG